MTMNNFESGTPTLPDGTDGRYTGPIGIVLSDTPEQRAREHDNAEHLALISKKAGNFMRSHAVNDALQRTQPIPIQDMPTAVETNANTGIHAIFDTFLYSMSSVDQREYALSIYCELIEGKNGLSQKEAIVDVMNMFKATTLQPGEAALPDAL